MTSWARKTVGRYWRRKNCSLRDSLHKWVPITKWLPEYSPKKDLPGDIAGGLAVGIMNIPQGLAFAMLASLPPITGLYVAMLPVLAYVVFGTSKHLSVGTFAVITIMVGNVIDKRTSASADVPPSRNTSSDSLNNSSSSSGKWSPEDQEKILISATLSLVVGIFQTVMGFARFGFITIFLSDPLVSGFTTGAGFWVFTTQIKHVLAIYPARYSGPFALIKTYIAIFRNIADVNVASLIIGVLCIVILISIKHFNQKYKLKFPIPAELIVVALCAGISYGANLKGKYHIKIVKSVPKGLPPVSVPRGSLITELMVDGFVIAVVAFAINISLAKLFSQKHKYPMDANQELIAYGLQNIVGGFFSGFVSAAALGRCLLQENLGKSQLTSVISSAIILLVLTVLAPLFEPLPNAVLGAIIIVAIRGCFKNFRVVKKLWRVSKIDALSWVVTWGAVVLFGMDRGLGIGVVFQLLSLTYRLSNPKFSVVGEVRGSVGVYEDVERYDDVVEVTGVVIVRFQSPLCFVNVERFKKELKKNVFADSSRRKMKVKTKHTYMMQPTRECLLERSSSSESGVSGASRVPGDVEQDVALEYIHSIIIDCAAFNFIDTVAVSTLSQIALEYKERDILVYLVNYSFDVLEVLKNGNFFNGDNGVCLLPNIQEALQHAYARRGEQSTDQSINQNAKDWKETLSYEKLQDKIKALKNENSILKEKITAMESQNRK